jgi:hypothetical protein
VAAGISVIGYLKIQQKEGEKYYDRRNNIAGRT